MDWETYAGRCLEDVQHTYFIGPKARTRVTMSATPHKTKTRKHMGLLVMNSDYSSTPDVLLRAISGIENLAGPFLYVMKCAIQSTMMLPGCER